MIDLEEALLTLCVCMKLLTGQGGCKCCSGRLSHSYRAICSIKCVLLYVHKHDCTCTHTFIDNSQSNYKDVSCLQVR